MERKQTKEAPVTRGLPHEHPGKLLKDVVIPAVNEQGTSTSKVAELLGISRPQLYDIMNEKKPISAQMAQRFGKLFGNGPELWMELQTRYDLALAKAELGEALDRIPTLPPAAVAA